MNARNNLCENHGPVKAIVAGLPADAVMCILQLMTTVF